MKRIVTYALGTSLGAVLLAGSYWTLFLYHHITTDDAYVQSDITNVSSQIEGVISRSCANETDFVEKGQLLATLDSSNCATRLKLKRANLMWSVRTARQLLDQELMSSSSLKLRLAELQKAKFDFSGREKLMQLRAISPEEYESAKAALQIAEAAFEVARHQLHAAHLLAASPSVREHPLVLVAKEELRQALLDFERCQLLAPVAGVIAKKNAQLGGTASPSRPLFAIASLERTWIEANFKETQLADLRVGQKATITADIYGKSVYYDAIISGIGAASGNLFALLPPQNATGNWIKVVQRVPVRLELDQEQLKSHPLCLGCSVRVDVDSANLSGSGLFEPSYPKAEQETMIYQLAYKRVELELESALKRAIDATSDQTYDE